VELYGADKILLLVARSLCRSYRVIVMVPKTGVLVDKIREVGVDVLIEPDIPVVHRKIMSFRGLAELARKTIKFRKRLKEIDHDMLYVNTLACALVSIVAGHGVYRLLHVHEIIESQLLNLMFSLLCRRFDKVVCVSSSVKENLLFSEDARYVVQYNGIPDFASLNRPTIQEGGRFTCVLPGRIMPEKGQWFVVEMLKKYRRDLVGLEIHFFGSPPPNRPDLINELTVWIESEGLFNVVTIHSFVEDVSLVYSMSDLVLVPSIMRDPFPTTVLEGMSASRAVVTTPNGGAAEIIKDSEDGYVIPAGDIDALYRVIRHCMDNRAEMMLVGTKARQKYEKLFTFDKFCENILALVESCLGVGGRHA